MDWLSTLIQQGGPSALSVLYLAGPAIILSLIYAITRRRWAWWAGSIAAGLMLVIAIVGYVDGRQRLDAGIAAMSRDEHASKADIDAMREDGSREAVIPLKIAGVLAGVCAIALITGRVRGKT